METQSKNTLISESDNQEQSAMYQHRDAKLYAGGNMFGAAFIGGLFATVYMMYVNYKEIGADDKAKKTLLYGTMGSAFAYIAAMIFVPAGTSFGMILAGIMYSIAYGLQKDILKEHKANDGEFQSLGKALLVALGGLVLFLVFIFSMQIIITPSKTSPVTLTPDVEIVKEDNLDATKNFEVSGDQSNTQPSSPTWKEYVVEEYKISFTYPVYYGEVYEEEIGATEASFMDSSCLGVEPLPLRCRGVVVGFDDGLGTSRDLIVVHGKDMKLPPQGGWWGYLRPESFSKSTVFEQSTVNPILYREANLYINYSEMGGDNNVQFILSPTEDISHVVVAAPGEFLWGDKPLLEEKTIQAREEHVSKVPNMTAEYPNPFSQEEYDVYAQAFEDYRMKYRFYIGDDKFAQDYLQVLKSLNIEQ